MAATYIAKTLQGLESVLARELAGLGATRVQESSRAVLFEADDEVLYKANYLCRTALRILKRIKSFEIAKQDDLYDEVYSVAWEKVFPVDALMTLSATCLDSVFTHSRFASQRMKDAIVDRFRRVLGQRPSVDNEYYTIRVELFMRQNHCEILLDSSGLSLHNRGYRKPNTDSFNEVMASGLLFLSGWKPGQDLLLPFCKDVLLPMEAAMQACGMPAGYYRKGYSFQYWNSFDPNLWRRVKEDALKQMHDPEGDIRAADSDGLAVERVEELLKKVRMHHDVDVCLFDFLHADRLDGSDTGRDLTVLVRMPYFGETQAFEAEDFCTQLGNVLKRQYAGAGAWVYAHDADALKFIGLKPKEKYLLGEVAGPARFWGFDIR